jgi:glycosyltransferase involved in cell wall biosynthesis
VATAVDGGVESSCRTLLIANPSTDLYGSDLQMLESVSGLREEGWRVVVAVPGTGPLVGALRDRGAAVRVVPFPALNRSAATPAGLVRLGAAATRAIVTIRAVLREERPELVYVNTLTLPWWLLATRGTGIPTLCHVHEAEAADPPVVRRALATPLRLADAVVVNSHATADVVLGSVPALRSRTRVVHNGVAGPASPVAALPRRRGHEPWRVAVVGRVSARKAPDVALEAVALLRVRGYDVEVGLHGTPGPGQEEYLSRLRARAGEPDLRGAVQFCGYTSPVWPALERSDVLLAPSLGESFGNAVVEGQLAGRPVVATAVQGHRETVEDGVTGLLVPPRDPVATADAVGRLLADPGRAGQLAEAGRRSAEARFSSARYRGDIAGLADELAARQARSPSAV